MYSADHLTHRMLNFAKIQPEEWTLYDASPEQRVRNPFRFPFDAGEIRKEGLRIPECSSNP